MGVGSSSHVTISPIETEKIHTENYAKQNSHIHRLLTRCIWHSDRCGTSLTVTVSNRILTKLSYD